MTFHALSRSRSSRRREWLVEEPLAAIREELDGILRGLGRVAAASELVEQLLASRGCVREEVPERRRAYGYAVLRAAVEADGIAEAPRFATRRHAGRLVVAVQVADDEPLDTPSDAALVDMAAGVADEAVTLAGRDPLPTPITVVRALAAAANRFDLLPAEQRLVQLAASASGTVLAGCPPGSPASPRCPTDWSCPGCSAKRVPTSLGRRAHRPADRDRLEQRAAVGIDLAGPHPAGGCAGRRRGRKSGWPTCSSMAVCEW